MYGSTLTHQIKRNLDFISLQDEKIFCLLVSRLPYDALIKDVVDKTGKTWASCSLNLEAFRHDGDTWQKCTRIYCKEDYASTIDHLTILTCIDLVYNKIPHSTSTSSSTIMTGLWPVVKSKQLDNISGSNSNPNLYEKWRAKPRLLVRCIH